MRQLFCYPLLVFLFCGCSSVSQTKNAVLAIVLFNGEGERAEVSYDGKEIINLPKIELDQNNVAAVKEVQRTRGRSELLVTRNGKTIGRFSIDSMRIGTVYLFLTENGSVILRDGAKMPPVL